MIWILPDHSVEKDEVVGGADKAQFYWLTPRKVILKSDLDLDLDLDPRDICLPENGEYDDQGEGSTDNTKFTDYLFID